jgi:WD40 repeat protein
VWDINALRKGGATVLLASVSHHSGHVHCVRWSKNGKLFASGSVDGTIHLYALQDGATVNGSLSKNKENWSRVATLQGHHADILDLDWSPSGQLVSASVDNTVIVWDCKALISGELGRNFRRLSIAPQHIFSGHASFVKGVTFDPVGNYIVSCSEDGSLLVVDCETWSEIAKLEGKCQSSERSIFSRLSWAPDGSSVCVSSGRKSTKPVGTILKRDTWDSVADLVGHDVECMSCRFFPSLLASDPATEALQPVCIVAIGDLNGRISVWSSSLKRPLMVLDDIVGSAITDISWYYDKEGAVLMASSLDGHLCAVDFGHLLGSVLNDNLQAKHFTRLYGQDHRQPTATRPTLIVDPNQLAFTTKVDEKLAVNESVIISKLPQRQVDTDGVKVNYESVQLSTEDVLAMQQKSKTKDGKKRIRPILVNTDSYSEEMDVTFPGSNSLSDTTNVPTPTTAVNGTRKFSSQSGDNAADYTRRTGSLTILMDAGNNICSLRAPDVSPLRCSLNSEVGNDGSFADYVVSAEPLAVPDVIKNSSLSACLVPTLSQIKLQKSNDVIWESYVTAAVSCLAASAGTVTGKIGCDNVSQRLQSGIIVVGCYDGTIFLLETQCGSRRSAPLVCGCAVAYVDIKAVTQSEGKWMGSTTAGESPVGDERLILACTADGEVTVWRTRSSPAAAEWAFPNIALSKIFRTALRPAILSVRSRNVSFSALPKNTALRGSDGTAESPNEDRGQVRVDTVSFTQNRQVKLTLTAKGSYGGDCQSFVFQEDAQCWVRVADMRHALSRCCLFIVSNICVSLLFHVGYFHCAGQLPAKWEGYRLRRLQVRDSASSQCYP